MYFSEAVVRRRSLLSNAKEVKEKEAFRRASYKPLL